MQCSLSLQRTVAIHIMQCISELHVIAVIDDNVIQNDRLLQQRKMDMNTFYTINFIALDSHQHVPTLA